MKKTYFLHVAIDGVWKTFCFYNCENSEVAYQYARNYWAGYTYAIRSFPEA